MVTAETAVVLPVLLLVLALCVGALVVVGAQLRCLDAAREGVRAAARGETEATVQRLVGAAGPAGARASILVRDPLVSVTVTAMVRPLGPVPWRFTLSASATGLSEGGDDGTP